jgi:nucleoside-diphosphate-sugar epimerase
VVTTPAHDILVTGAAGFLGRAVIEQLALMGRPATGIARRALPGVQQVSDYAEAPAASVIIHLAEEADRAVANRLGDAYADAAARIMCSLVSRAGRVVYASSGTVYGDGNESPCTPATPVLASDTYSQSKLRNESLVRDAGGTVLRLANLYGSGMSSTNVVSDIARQLGSAGPLRVRDDTPVRDFLRVEDAARAIALAAMSGGTGTFNVGSGTGFSIRELAGIALLATGQLEREIVASQSSSRRSINILDVDDTQRCLGWAPTPAAARQLATFFRLGAGLDQ